MTTPCHGQTDRWFPIGPTGPGPHRDAFLAEVAATCQLCLTACPLLEECRDLALAHGARDGIWAGVWLDGGAGVGTHAQTRQRLEAVDVPVSIDAACVECGTTFHVERPAGAAAGKHPTVCGEECRKARKARTDLRLRAHRAQERVAS